MSFLEQKDQYAEEQALVFRDIDYLMVTYRLLCKDYAHLAKCLVPIGNQIGKSQKELSNLLRTKTKRFTDKEIQNKFRQFASKHG